MIQNPLLTFALITAVCWLSASTADAQGQRGPGGWPLLSLATREPVQKELGLSRDAVEKVKKIDDAYFEESRAEMRKIASGRVVSLPDEDRKTILAATAAVRDRLMPQFKEALTADQYTRLQQIDWQAQRSLALADPDVVKALDLSRDQQDKISAVSKEYREQAQTLSRGGGQGGNNKEAFAKMQELIKQRDAKAAAILTGEQQDKFTVLKGKPFDTTTLWPANAFPK